MNSLVITNALIINDNARQHADVMIRQGRIEHIDGQITVPANCQVIDAAGKWLIPGMIDDQVHFREPGLTHKGTIASESRAAVAGGITSFMEMPNVTPPTTSRAALAEKFHIAARVSPANFSFYFGATNDNLEELKRLGKNEACGVKVFMGASTGNMLVDNTAVLEKVFQHAPCLVATHCEDTPMIKRNEQIWLAKYGADIPAAEHPHIRSVEACLRSSALAVELAKKYQTRLHVLHITTADELALFEAAPHHRDLAKKMITAEACVHHLWFNQDDYQQLGHRLKCNPAVKHSAHQQALWQAVRDGVIDVIATDHAPHLPEEKAREYLSAPAGLPLVQHALPALFDLCARNIFTPELIVSKTSHAVAERYQIKDRGYIREGYWADVVLIDPERRHIVRHEDVLYQCGWTPFADRTFSGGAVVTTLVNGNIVWQNGRLQDTSRGMPLTFCRD